MDVQFAQFLALAGFLPLIVLVAMHAFAPGKPFVPLILQAYANHDSTLAEEVGVRLVLVGILLGITPDVFVMLEPEVPGFLIIDRILDLVTTPILIVGVLLMRAASATNLLVSLKLWIGALFVCATLAAIAAFIV